MLLFDLASRHTIVTDLSSERPADTRIQAKFIGIGYLHRVLSYRAPSTPRGRSGRESGPCVMRRLDRCDLRVLAEELPATLFVAFNVLMAWMAWALYADVTRWRGLSAAGELASVPPNEPAASEAIMAGLPLMWLLGAVALGVLAAYWHLSVVGKSGRSDAARAGPPDRSSGGSRASAK